jgi:uncharacterized surface protein with fasciclin (FAS1) repeats
MKKLFTKRPLRFLNVSGMLFLAIFGANAQTNVYDDVINVSPDHTSLAAAIQQAGLVSALQDPNATYTVFAPTNEAFDELAIALNTDISGLLALPNLSDILLYHVLGVSVPSTNVTNGLIATPLNPANTLKFTVGTAGVFVNHAEVTAFDISTDNGIVHVTDAVVLSNETVADVAIDNGFTSLVAAVVEARLLPALTNPFASFTVFAPTNAAFDNLATALGTDIAGLLALPNLADVLLYHVLGAEVVSSGVTNGLIATPLNAANTLKFTTGTAGIFVNQAEITAVDIAADNGVVHVLDAVVLPAETVADVAIDNGFTSLVAAVVEARLLPALTNPFASFTVFAPTNAAFDNLATALGTDIAGLLELPNLADVLLYHVLGAEVASSGVTNGLIATPLNAANTLKFTTGTAGIFVNQAEITAVDIAADNGVVHVLDAVVLSAETVADVAIDNGFTSLVAAVVEARLLPALTNPFASFTVFAPTNAAFDNLATALGTDIAGLLALPNLADVLLYHVLGAEVASSGVTNGLIATPLNAANTLKFTVGTAGVFVNQAEITGVDLGADNGVVHVLDAVVLPSETVADIAIGSAAHTSLVAAVVQARLLPALTNPFASLTVFAPTNDAFADLATALGTDLAGVLASPALTEILLYHVVGAAVLSTELTDGPVATLNGQNVIIDLSGMGVMVNTSNVILADLEADNGVVHAIDAVLVPSLANLSTVSNIELTTYPNPATDMIKVIGLNDGAFELVDMKGTVVKKGNLVNNEIQLSDLNNGSYLLRLQDQNTVQTVRVVKQ